MELAKILVITIAMAANIGASALGVLGSMLGIPFGPGELASMGANAVLQGYSREQELEADMLGARYLARTGYDPSALTRFFGKLRQHARLEAALAGKEEDAESHRILSTHPRTVERIRQAIALAHEAPTVNPRTGRDEYLNHIDGLLFGDDPRQGVRVGRVFSHPNLRIRFEVPEGFHMFNSPKAVIARGPDGASLSFRLLAPGTAARVGDLATYVADDWGKSTGIRDVEHITVNGMEGATGHSTMDGALDVRLVAVRESRQRIFRFVFLTPKSQAAWLNEAFRHTTHSLRRLSPEEAALIRPLRVRVITMLPNETTAGLAASVRVSKSW